MIKLTKILVPTDFSDSSLHAAKYACELSKRFGAELHLLHVVEPVIMAMPSPGAPLPDQLLADNAQAAEERLPTWLSEVERPEAMSHSVRRGPAFVEIVRCAKEQDADLIVLATHGRSGLTHALIGSVAERVVQKANCPVLTVRPEGHQFVMP